MRPTVIELRTSKPQHQGGSSMQQKSKIIIGALLGSSLVACTVDDSATESATESGASVASGSRVWIQYKSNRKDDVKAALGAAHATLHYEFDNIEAVVATVPSGALNGLANNPNVNYVEDDVPREPY